MRWLIWIVLILLAPIVAEAGDLFTIAGFGDSVTAGYPYQYVGDGCRCGGYVARLEELLQNYGVSGEVLNYGVSGERTSEGLNRLPAVLSESEPDVVLLMEGVNDHADPLSHSGLAAMHMAQMIDIVRTAGAVPVLATITPNFRKYFSQSNHVQETNAWLIFVALWKRVLLVDQYGAAQGDWPHLHAGDRLHPNRSGYSLIARTWLNRILPMLYDLRAGMPLTIVPRHH